MTEYHNPILAADYPDPDIIRVGTDFYMVSSSFNYMPSVPVMHSKDLVHWQIINYVLPKLAKGYKKVRSSCGTWAPSLRFRDGVFYCLIPFPDEGIFVAETRDINGPWSPLRCLLKGPGYEDPCPLWSDGKAYVVFAFVGSRIGFNSKLGLFETDAGFRIKAKNYTIIYDGTGRNPIIEGPKLYEINGFVYILAPAGGVEHGYQVALRGKSVFGPFEEKIILREGSGINGPHQGALVDINDAGKYVFAHFRSEKGLGRVLYLEPCSFQDDWPVVGDSGLPVTEGSVDLPECDMRIAYSDTFSDDSLSLVWQTPAVVDKRWLTFKHKGLIMHARLIRTDMSSYPYLLLQKVSGFCLTAKVRYEAKLSEGESAGLGVFGLDCAYICLSKSKGRLALSAISYISGRKKEIIISSQAANIGILTIRYDYPDTVCFPSFGSSDFHLAKEKWVGLHIGLFCLKTDRKTCGRVLFSDFKVSYL